MRRILIYMISAMVAVCSASPAIAQSAMTDEEFDAYTVALREKGGNAYLNSNKTEMASVIMEFQDAISERKATGKLTSASEDYLMAIVNRLQGDYHYENSDVDSKSYELAEEYFKKALAYYSAHPSNSESRDTADIHVELAQLYYKQARYPEALEEIKSAYAQYEAEWERDFCEESEYYNVLSGLAMCQARTGLFAEALKHVDEVIKNYQNKDDIVYADAMRKKAKILMLQQEATGSVAKEALDCYRTGFQQRRADVQRHLAGMTANEREQYWLRQRPFLADCYRLESVSPEFLYDVTLFSKGLLLYLYRISGDGKAGNDAVSTLGVTWQQVQKSLPQDGCAIEFVQYEKFGCQRMAALVLAKQGTPKFVQMMAPDSLFNYKIGIHSVKDRLTHAGGERKNAFYTDTLGMGKMLWNKELLQAIGKADKVYFSADGYVHQIAIEYLLPPEARHLKLYRLSSTRRLLDGTRRDKISNALICGGIKYDEETASVSYPEDSPNDTKAFEYLRSTGSSFPYLENSLVEVQQISSCRNNPADTLVTGLAATEDAFRRLAPQYQLVHISTHGYFGGLESSVGTDLKPCLYDDALSESGLLFAGAVQHLKSGTEMNAKDGILSALELSRIDLSQVQLMVVAACQTGLGYVTADGIYGIQRGLKNAGVDAVMVSLWEVSDMATTSLMSYFHQYLASGLSVNKSFALARHRMKSKDNEDYDYPQFTNAFILIDAFDL